MSEETKVADEIEQVPSESEPPYRFICGPAGCGKTFQAKEDADYRTLLVSTTGIAAINLGGTTINAAIGYFDYGSLKENYTNGWLQSRLRKYRSGGTTRIVVDEASMMDGRQLVVLCKGIDEVNEDVDRGWDGDDSDDPRIHLTLVGDFAQLPPVDAPFCFEVPVWERFERNTVRMTGTRRQDDADFIGALRCARRGDGRGALEYFRARLHPTKDDSFDGPTVLATNVEVDRFNSLRYDLLGGNEFVFRAKREGKQRGEWKHIPDELRLREGALVMILSNYKEPGSRHYTYINGDLGTFEGYDEAENAFAQAVLGRPASQVALVRLQRTGQVTPVVQVRREFLVPTGALGVRKEKFTVEGWVEYTPLRLAWACTVHKSQGLSLDKVQVAYQHHFFSNPGSLYVALSRARSAEGLRLVGTPEVFVERCRADPRVERWL
jgi:hypothetical protein